jgi:hypothetical protein
MRFFLARLFLIALVLLTTACSSAPREPDYPRGRIKSFSLIPATPPSYFSYEEADLKGSTAFMLLPSLGPGMSAQKEAKVAAFNTQMRAYKTSLDIALTEATVHELVNLGYKITVLENIDRRVNKPDNVDYDRLTYESDAVLHLFFNLVGVNYSRKSGRILPQLNTGGIVAVKGRNRYVANKTVFFGIDANSTDQELGFANEFERGYANHEGVMANLAKIHAIYAAAIPKIAKRMAKEIHDEVK